MKATRYLIAVPLFIGWLTACTNGNTEKELDLRERELILKEKQYYLDSIQFHSQSDESNNESSKNGLNGLTNNETGLFMFPYQSTAMEIYFHKNTQTLSRTFIDYHRYPDMEEDEVIEMKDKGVYTIDFLNNDYKQITATYENDGQSYVFKYYFKKKTWIMETYWEGDDHVFEIKGARIKR